MGRTSAGQPRRCADPRTRAACRFVLRDRPSSQRHLARAGDRRRHGAVDPRRRCRTGHQAVRARALSAGAGGRVMTESRMSEAPVTGQASIRVNGETEPLAAATLAALFAEKAVDTEQKGIAVALNGAVVPRAAWPGTALKAGDNIEIVRARQGG